MNEMVMQRIANKQPLFRIESKSHTHSLLPCIYNRKDKSLEELSKRFLQQMMQYDSKFIYLDHLTHQLDVERRRLYDIINILESLKVVTRQCKNKYCWNGFNTIYHTILQLKLEQEGDCRSGRKEKSLEVLSVGFLKLFNRKQTWTLEVAARSLSPLGIEDAKLKTTIRRLYDIANVLKSIGLIRRCQNDRKAGYEWVGERGLDLFRLEMAKLPPQPQQDMFDVSPEKKQKMDTPDAPLQSVVNMSGFYNFVMQVVMKQQFSDLVTQTVDKSDQENQNPQTKCTAKIRPTLTIIHPPGRVTPFGI